MEFGYEFFDHTADLGVRVRAQSWTQLVHAAGQALYAAIGELAVGDAVEPLNFDFSGSEPAYLFHDYLGELLALLDKGRMVTMIQSAQCDPHHLRIQARLGAVDHQRSRFLREVKAVTYHELSVRSTPEGIEATFIVDI